MAAGSTDQVLGDAQKQLNQNRRPSCRPGSSPRTRMAVASGVFRACPVPDVGSSAACRGSNFHSLLKAQIPWPQGKTQGIFSIQPFFAKICLENSCEFNSLRMNSLLEQGRVFFLSAQGINSARRQW